METQSPISQTPATENLDPIKGPTSSIYRENVIRIIFKITSSKRNEKKINWEKKMILLQREENFAE
jgi:hypothetical protein